MSSYTPPAAAVKELRSRTQAGMLDCVKALQASNGSMDGAIDHLRKKGMATAVSKAGRTAAQGVIAAVVDDAGRAGMVELNCETDFVARNADFTSLATGIATTALSTCTPPVDFSLDAATGVSNVSAASLSELNAATLSGSTLTVSAAIVGAIGRMGENVILRRAVLLPRATDCHVAAYMHNASATGVGSVGVLLALSVTGGAGGVPQPLRALARKLAMHVAAAKPGYLTRAHVPASALQRERDVLTAQAAGSGKPAAIIARMVDGRISKFYSESVLLEQPFILSEDGKAINKVLVEAAKANGVEKVTVAGFAHFITGETVSAAPPPAAASQPAGQA